MAKFDEQEAHNVSEGVAEACLEARDKPTEQLSQDSSSSYLRRSTRSKADVEEQINKLKNRMEQSSYLKGMDSSFRTSLSSRGSATDRGTRSSINGISSISNRSSVQGTGKDRLSASYRETTSSRRHTVMGPLSSRGSASNRDGLGSKEAANCIGQLDILMGTIGNDDSSATDSANESDQRSRRSRRTSSGNMKQLDDDSTQNRSRRGSHLSGNMYLSNMKQLDDDSTRSLSSDSRGMRCLDDLSECSSIGVGARNAEKFVEQFCDKKEAKESPLYHFLNVDPTQEDLNLEEDALLEMLNEGRARCFHYYQFDNAFPNEFLPPLHVACCLGFRYEIIKKIHKCYPNAILYTSKHSNMNVLHYAVMYTRAPLKVIKFLTKQYLKASVNMSALLGDLDNQGSPANSKKAIKALTEALDNEHLRTPLHMACSCSPSYSFFNPEIIVMLTEINARSAMLLDKNGCTPLHLACQVDRPSLKVIDDLTTVHADACLVADNTKEMAIPLHYLLCHPHVSKPYNEFVDIVKYLVKSQPLSCKVERQRGGYVLNYRPIFIALDHYADFKIIKTLVRQWPGCLLQTDTGKSNGKNPYKFAMDIKNISNERILGLLA